MSLPILIRKLRSAGYRVARRLRDQPTWRGVYERVEDVPVRGGYEADLWIAGTTEYVRAAMRDGMQLEGDRALLAFVVATQTTGGARILDYGGGMGLDFVLLRNTLGAAAIAEYRVVDVPRVIAVGSGLLPEIRFGSDLPEDPGVLDLVYVRSALQSVPDPFASLRKLLSYGAPHVLILDVPAGDIPTFITAQLNVPGTVLAYWFFNLGELERVARDSGYEVVLRTNGERRRVRLDAPPRYQLARTANLLLRRAG